MVAKQFKCTYNLYRKLTLWLISTAATFTADITAATTTVTTIISTATDHTFTTSTSSITSLPLLLLLQVVRWS